MDKRWEVLEKLLGNKKKLVIAEIGVFEGKTSKYLLEKLDIKKYYLIDAYETYEEYEDTKADRYLLEKAEESMKKIINGREGAVHLKMLSRAAAEIIPNGSLDLVFIDANHDYKYVKEDLELWKEKVKENGILSGHDYNYPNITGVKKAVDEAFGSSVRVMDDYVWYVER